MTRAELRDVPVPTEHAEQVALMTWARIMAVTGRHPELAYLTAVPNFSGRLGNAPPIAAIRQAQRLKKEGRRKGYPDLLLDVARGGYHGWRGEMKREKGGTVSMEQKAWHIWLQAQGYRVDVCKGSEAMQAALVAYLTLPPTELRRYAPGRADA